MADEGMPWAGTSGTCLFCRLGQGGGNLYRRDSRGAANGQPRSLWYSCGGGGHTGVRILVPSGYASSRGKRCQWGRLHGVVGSTVLGGGRGRSGRAVSSVPVVHVDVVVLWWGRGHQMRRVDIHTVGMPVQNRCDGQGQRGACGDRWADLLVQPCGVHTHQR